MKNIGTKIQNRLVKILVRPIRVLCFHQVSNVFDPLTMWECDWTQTERFKQNILHLKEEYTFIPLQEAYTKLRYDMFRCKKYAVLTADDGWASLRNIVPWLVENNVPITLFVNPAYLDGKHYQERSTEKLLTFTDLQLWLAKYPQHVFVASHGWTHQLVTKMSSHQFENSLFRAEKVLNGLPNKIPYYAFSHGLCTIESIEILRKYNLHPVLIDGGVNYKYNGCIQRECIDGKML